MRLRINEYELTDKNIKNNIKILCITDVHSNVNNLNEIIKKLKDINPNYIFFVGDTFDSFNNKLNDEIVSLLKSISEVYNTFICLGNHDLLYYKRYGLFSKAKYTGDFKYFNILKKETKIHVLIDDIYEDNNISVYALNLNDDWYHEQKENKKIFKKYFDEFIKNNKMNKNKFNILLLHSSNGIIDKNKLIDVDANINLILCGHNHGGLTFKFIQKLSKNNRGIVLPNRGFFKKSAYGIYNKNNTSLLLSCGLTKLGKSHLGDFLSEIGNNILGSDVEFIYLSKGIHNLRNK